MKYCWVVKSTFTAPKWAVYSPTSKKSPTWVTEQMYIPAPKKKILPREL